MELDRIFTKYNIYFKQTEKIYLSSYRQDNQLMEKKNPKKTQ